MTTTKSNRIEKKTQSNKFLLTKHHNKICIKRIRIPGRVIYGIITQLICFLNDQVIELPNAFLQEVRRSQHKRQAKNRRNATVSQQQ